MKKLVLIALLVLAALVVPAAAPSAGHEPMAEDPSGVRQNCLEVIPTDSAGSGATYFRVDYAAADALVPEDYKVKPFDDSSTAETENYAALDFNVSKCDLEFGEAVFGEVRKVEGAITARFAVYVTRDTNTITGPPHDVGNDLYTIEVTTNSKEWAHWLRRGTGLGDKVRVVSGLEFRYDPEPTDPITGQTAPGAIDEQFLFRAPVPALSPFTIEGTVREPFTPSICCAGGNAWASTEAGTVILFLEHLDLGTRIGSAGGVITSHDSNSPLGRMLGSPDEQRREFPSAEDDPNRGGVSAGLDKIQWTKCVRTDSNPCSDEEHADPCLPLNAFNPECDPATLLMGSTAGPFAALALAIAVSTAATRLRRTLAITTREKEGSAS